MRLSRSPCRARAWTGQISWCYIDDWSAANIVNDAIAAGNEGVRDVKDACGF
jgi:hypothetical protein